MALDAQAGPTALRVRCNPARPLVWCSAVAGRARRNTAGVLEGLVGRRVAAVRVADRDRHLLFDLDRGGGSLLILPFGPRPNALLVDAAGDVEGAFLREPAWRGRPAPAPRPAPWPAEPGQIAERWRPSGSAAEALARAVPTLGRLHALEACARVGLDPADPAEPRHDWGALLAGANAVEQQVLDRPRPHVYSAGRVPEGVSLVPLSAPPAGWEARAFGTADEVARAWAISNLAAERFLDAYRPLESALSTAARRLADSARSMAAELERPSRADRHERDAHLLMSQPDGRRTGMERLVVADILEGGADIEIALNARLTLVENAERLYDRARQARAAREHAAGRRAEVEAAAARAAALAEELHAMAAGGASAKDLEAWARRHSHELARYSRAGAADGERLPYLRFELPGGWEVRVGRSARDNAELTARHASPHDMWLHARGVAGSHVVLRRPARTATPGRNIIEAAAALAAYHSKARGQALVPVIVTERKYVRPVKGGAPGLVRVEREEVLMVEPRSIGAAE